MKHRIPCFIPVGRIGDGIDYNSCTVEDEYTMIKKVYLAIEITNNNFAPAYCKGDRILLENRFPELGECAVYCSAALREHQFCFANQKMSNIEFCIIL